jgi:hypothetical protein
MDRQEVKQGKVKPGLSRTDPTKFSIRILLVRPHHLVPTVCARIDGIPPCCEKSVGLVCTEQTSRCRCIPCRSVRLTRLTSRRDGPLRGRRTGRVGGSSSPGKALMLNSFLTLLCESAVWSVHATLGIRRRARKGGARRGLPGSHGPAGHYAVSGLRKCFDGAVPRQRSGESSRSWDVSALRAERERDAGAMESAPRQAVAVPVAPDRLSK